MIVFWRRAGFGRVCLGLKLGHLGFRFGLRRFGFRLSPGFLGFRFRLNCFGFGLSSGVVTSGLASSSFISCLYLLR